MHPGSMEYEQARRANELYWDTGMGVNQIASTLDVSKGVLYALIRPLEAEKDCPRCGAEMMFANRTAREQGVATCPHCTAGAGASAEEEGEEEDRGEAPAPPSARGLTSPVRMVVAGAVVLTAGALLIRWMRRR